VSLHLPSSRQVALSAARGLVALACGGALELRALGEPRWARALPRRGLCSCLLHGELLLLAWPSQPFVAPLFRQVSLELRAWDVTTWAAAGAVHRWKLPAGRRAPGAAGWVWDVRPALEVVGGRVLLKGCQYPMRQGGQGGQGGGGAAQVLGPGVLVSELRDIRAALRGGGGAAAAAAAAAGGLVDPRAVEQQAAGGAAPAAAAGAGAALPSFPLLPLAEVTVEVPGGGGGAGPAGPLAGPVLRSMQSCPGFLMCLDAGGRVLLERIPYTS
jgi:hypothetical protein